MASYNPYRLDPNIAQGFSNLTRALIGSAQDDASLASARASDARAGLYSSQAEGENIANQIQRDFLDRTRASMGNSDIVNLLGGLMGFPNPMIEKEVVVEGRPHHYAPAMQEVPTYDQDAYSALVGALAFGQGGTANQTSQAAMNLREMGQLEQARKILLDELAAGGSPENIATILSGMTPGKYTQSNIAPTEIANALAGEIYAADTKLEGDKFETKMKFGEGGSEERIAELNALTEEAWQNYKADKVAESESEKTEAMYGEDGYYDRKAKLDDDFKRWEHENRTIQMSVEAGKKIVVDPETGRRLKIKPNKDGLYVLDGGKDPTKVMVKVGKEDVYLSEEHAEALGIKKNAKGLYVIPGAGYASDGSSSSSSGGKSGSTASGGTVLDSQRFQEMWKENWKDVGSEDMPIHAIGGLQVAASNAIARDKEEAEANGTEFNFQTSYTANAMPMITAGVIKITKGSNFFFPKYFFDFFTRMPDASFNAEKLKQYSVRTLGYSEKQAENMMFEVLQARARN